ncbi:hypothetical protein RB595_008479 [Gaeumannomyces hyphopodioides]
MADPASTPAMASSSPVVIFGRQTWALTRKNLIHLVIRRWFVTAVQCLILPIVLVGVFTNIQNFARPKSVHGFAPPGTVRSFEDSLSGGRDFLIVTNATNQGSDLQRVVQGLRDQVTKRGNKFVAVDRWQDIESRCIVNRQGFSNCHSAVWFKDSPLSHPNGTGNWSYSILTDPGQAYSLSFDVFDYNSPGLASVVPLQLAINALITNRTQPSLQVVQFSYTTQEEADQKFEIRAAMNNRSSFALIYFVTQLFGVYLIVGFITTERGQGVSHLVDVMGGGAAAARVCSNILAFNALYLPYSIAAGVLYRQYILPLAHPALVLFWSILATMAIVNSAVFAASFFRGSRLSSVVAVAANVGIAAGALIVDHDTFGKEGTVIALAFLFPSANFIHTLCLMLRSIEVQTPVDVNKVWMDIFLIRRPYSPALIGVPLPSSQVVGLSIWMYLIFVVIQILAYPLLAILVERLLHGVSFKRRTFVQGPEADASPAAIEATGLRKEYPPSILKRIFCCAGRKSTVTAVDGLDLVAQKGQILCLLGVNGSGKSTTLEILSGHHSSTAGQVKINSPPTKLGVCPQKNVLFPYLTVLEHVRIWSRIKNGHEDEEEIRGLVEYCDLKDKTNSQARHLSGGQKRKLQCLVMLAGGSTTCLIDEVTTGLDPISRRSIWNMLLGIRATRSVIFTTHFLDEGESLADQIVLLSKGKVMCQGSAAELKSKYGGGYTVHIPRTDTAPDMGVPVTTHQDRICYNVPSTAAAAALISKLEKDGQRGIAMSGPTVEDVFLRLTTDVDEILRRELGGGGGAPSAGNAPGGSAAAGLLPAAALASGKPISSFRQIVVLMRKRLTVLPRYWVAPLLALVLSCAVPPLCRPLLNVYKNGRLVPYERPTCEVRDETSAPAQSYEPFAYPAILSASQYSKQVVPVGPPSINASLTRAVYTMRPDLEPKYWPDWRFVDTVEEFQNTVRANTDKMSQGIFVKDGGNSAMIAARMGEVYSGVNTVALVNLWTMMEMGANVTTAVGTLPMERGYSVLYSENGVDSLGYVLAVCAVLAIYPSFFSLYVAYERSHMIRQLEYTNGVRPFPLWMSHLLFDSSIVLVASLALVGTISSQVGYTWYEPGYMFIVAFLYGLASMLVAYLVSAKLARTQLAAYMWTYMLNIVGYLATFLAFFIAPFNTAPEDLLRVTDSLSWGLGAIFPVASMLKSLMVGLNTFKLACRTDGHIPYGGHIHGYGGPILLLLIQIVLLGLLLVWLESSNSFAAMGSFLRQAVRQKKLPASGAMENEEAELTGAAMDGVSKEAARVGTTTTDLLRVSHVSKSFGDNKAVEDVTFGLGEGEILALLGPNGAGKTTLINMMTGELRPDAGEMMLRGVNVHTQTRLAQRSLGVCPQFDALDLMTARQHLEFYARVRGVDDVKRNVDVVLDRTGLTSHASRAASKLSGGNKRKLSLGIALIGNPDVLVLDEPSSAMDAASKRVMWRTLAEVGPGRSLLLTTHSMEEADALATRAAIVSKRLLAIGTTQQLRGRYSNLYHVQLVLRSAPESTRDEMERVEGWVRAQFGGAVAFEGRSLGGQVKFTVPNSEAGRGSTSSSISRAATADDEAVLPEDELGGSDNDRGAAKNNTTTTLGDNKTIGEVIQTLEAHKEELGLLDYSIGAPTLEKVFMSVVKENYVEEEGRKRRWWQFGRKRV